MQVAKKRFCCLVVLLTLATSYANGAEEVLFSENFNALSDLLEPAENEPIDPTILGWTHETPPGWEIANFSLQTGELIPGIDDDTQGVAEWEGWSFTTMDFWLAADGQRREEFVLADGVFAVADPDEWDDLGDPENLGTRPCDLCGPYNTLLFTPEIDLSNVTPGTVELTFDSSWRPECDSTCQAAQIIATYDNGNQDVIMEWSSDPTSPNFKDDNSTNETLTIPVEEDTDTVAFVFTMLDAGNDWWWAIDNVEVTGDVNDGQGGPDCDLNADSTCDVADLDLLNQDIVAGTKDASEQGAWLASAATENGLSEPYPIGDANLDGSVNASDLNAVGRNWQQSVSLWSEGDFDANGIVNAADLNGLGSNWQKTVPAAVGKAAVPEPSSVVLLLAGLVSFALVRKSNG